MRVAILLAVVACGVSEEPYSDVPALDVHKPDVVIVESSVAGRVLPVPVKAAYVAFLAPERFKALSRQPDDSLKVQEFADAKHPDREVAFAGIQLMLGQLKKHADGRTHVGFTLMPAIGDRAELRALISVSGDDAGPTASGEQSVQDMLLSYGFACYDCRDGCAPDPWHARFEAAQESAKLQMRGCWKSDLEAMAELAQRCAAGTPGAR